MALERQNSSQVVTYAPDLSSPRWLGAIGHVTNLKYSYSLPGGPDQMSCLLQVPPYFRTDALNPGRVVKIFRGGGEIWDGKLDEPQPALAGWTVSAHGAGTFGADFAAVWTTWNADDPVNQAISRGLRWVNPGIGSPAGIYLAQQQDSGAETVTAHLNLITTGGALTWYVGRHNILSVLPLPAVANRLLVTGTPVARTVAADINAIQLRYQVTADSGSKAATYAVTSATVPASIAAHGRMEYYQDLSSGGVMTAAQAQAVGNAILARYQRANFAGPFTAAPGQLLTLGGTPVDLGCEQAGTVVRLMVTDAGYGGEVTPGPVQFIVGGYEYDDEAQTATITPFQRVAGDMATLISGLYPGNKY